jgi:hypothetical protein
VTGLAEVRAMKGRCAICGWSIRFQGHHPDCPRAKCRRCKEFDRLPGQRLCCWCIHADEKRRAAVEARIREMDREFRRGATPGQRRAIKDLDAQSVQETQPAQEELP